MNTNKYVTWVQKWLTGRQYPLYPPLCGLSQASVENIRTNFKPNTATSENTIQNAKTFRSIPAEVSKYVTAPATCKINFVHEFWWSESCEHNNQETVGCEKTLSTETDEIKLIK